MRVMGGFLAAVLLAAVMTTPVVGASTAEEREEARRILRRALKLEENASLNMPNDFETAKKQLLDSHNELDDFDGMNSLPRLIRDMALRVAYFDGNVRARIRDATADGDVTDEELADLQWRLSVAIGGKTEVRDRIDELEFKETGKKYLPNTKVGAPQCQSENQQGRARSAGVSSCYTVDTWRIFVPENATAAFCRFLDKDGDQLTTLWPIFKNVIQETSCRLLDKTVRVKGVEKRVVRAKLTLSALSIYESRGTAEVRVGALYR